MFPPASPTSLRSSCNPSLPAAKAGAWGVLNITASRGGVQQWSLSNPVAVTPLEVRVQHGVRFALSMIPLKARVQWGAQQRCSRGRSRAGVSLQEVQRAASAAARHPAPTHPVLSMPPLPTLLVHGLLTVYPSAPPCRAAAPPTWSATLQTCSPTGTPSGWTCPPERQCACRHVQGLHVLLLGLPG